MHHLLCRGSGDDSVPGRLGRRFSRLSNRHQSRDAPRPLAQQNRPLGVPDGPAQQGVCSFNLNVFAAVSRHSFPLNCYSLFLDLTDDRASPPAPESASGPAPVPAPASLPVSLPVPVTIPPKRPDKATKPKLPPRPLSKVFSSSEHGADVLQVYFIK